MRNNGYDRYTESELMDIIERLSDCVTLVYSRNPKTTRTDYDLIITLPNDEGVIKMASPDRRGVLIFGAEALEGIERLRV